MTLSLRFYEFLSAKNTVTRCYDNNRVKRHVENARNVKMRATRVKITPPTRFAYNIIEKKNDDNARRILLLL